MGISTIASAIGHPLYVDLHTEQVRTLSYVRVCVELNAEHKLPDSILVGIEGTTR